MVALGILAYNEEKNILTIIKENYKKFDQIIVVEDSSTDSTLKILLDAKMIYNNLVILKNEVNYGAGRSFEILINYFLNSENSYLVKIDGDNQFDKSDIEKIKDLIVNKKLDFIKCNRFWNGGIIGDIPKIRYFGNLLASLLLKFASGNPFLTDPLNGLMAFSKKSLKDFKLTKRFYKYGYPFFVCLFFSQKLYYENLRYMIFNNKVTYFENKKNIRPWAMFFRLFKESLKRYFLRINYKIRLSDLQTSFLLDLAAITFMIFQFFSLFKLFSIRYFYSTGSQTIWFTIFLLFFISWVVLLSKSFEIEKKYFEKYLFIDD